MVIKLSVTEKVWHGCKYSVVKPYLDSWDLTRNDLKWNEISQWCYDTYGKPGDPWATTTDRWYLNNSSYWFRNESDRTMFVLRWS